MIELHRPTSVSTASIELDATLWNSVRMVFPETGGPTPSGKEIVFAVAARDGRLVLLADFELFVSLRNAGAQSVTVYRIEPDAGDSFVEYAIALAIPH